MQKISSEQERAAQSAQLDALLPYATVGESYSATVARLVSEAMRTLNAGFDASETLSAARRAVGRLAGRGKVTVIVANAAPSTPTVAAPVAAPAAIGGPFTITHTPDKGTRLDGPGATRDLAPIMGKRANGGQGWLALVGPAGGWWRPKSKGATVDQAREWSDAAANALRAAGATVTVTGVGVPATPQAQPRKRASRKAAAPVTLASVPPAAPIAAAGKATDALCATLWQQAQQRFDTGDLPGARTLLTSGAMIDPEYRIGVHTWGSLAALVDGVINGDTPAGPAAPAAPQAQPRKRTGKARGAAAKAETPTIVVAPDKDGGRAFALPSGANAQAIKKALRRALYAESGANGRLPNVGCSVYPGTGAVTVTSSVDTPATWAAIATVLSEVTTRECGGPVAALAA